jgi:hypothetical protein
LKDVSVGLGAKPVQMRLIFFSGVEDR